MIIREFYTRRYDGVNLYRTYSDRDVCIMQETGIVYDEAIDVEDTEHTYTETDIPIPQTLSDITEAEALDILLGRETE